MPMMTEKNTSLSDKRGRPRRAVEAETIKLKMPVPLANLLRAKAEEMSRSTGLNLSSQAAGVMLLTALLQTDTRLQVTLAA
jgi:hypothetical protein